MNLTFIKKWQKNFLKSLCSFETDSKDSFHNAILYGLIFKLSPNKEKVDRTIAAQILGKKFFNDFQKKGNIEA